MGAPATLNMIGGTSKPSRTIHLIGTRGEIRGCLEDSTFSILRPDPRPGCETAEEVVDLNVMGDMVGAGGGHAGGDMRLVADFIKLLNGEPRVDLVHGAGGFGQRASDRFLRGSVGGGETGG